MEAKQPNFEKLQPRVSLVACIATLAIFAASSIAQESTTPDSYTALRQRLVETVLEPGGIRSADVLRVMGTTPRHEFVPPALRDQAYIDRALPIGEAQTISSPFIVALMTEVLQPKKTDKVLEIGTGSGYQAAVLSPLVDQVYTIEIVEELLTATAKLLQRLGYKNVFPKAGDGFQGWAEHAPFDKIIVTCSPDKPPQPLIDQLREGGLMVIPVGTRYQQLLRVFRKQEGKLVPIYSRPTLFVPMTGTAESTRQDVVDPENPSLLNGDFEIETTENYIPNWYYEFGAKLVEDPKAPSGKHAIQFTNEKPSSPAGLLQGIPLDGRRVAKVRLSGYVQCAGIKLSPVWEEQPFIVLQFLDENRNQISYNWLGPFIGDFDWKQVEQTFAVPPESREAIAMIGLFGAVGTATFDRIVIEVVERKSDERKNSEANKTAR